MLLEDLGSQKLSSLLKQKGEQWPHYQHALDALVTLQSIAGEGMHLPAYDEAAIMRELLLFTEWYLPAFTGEFVELEQIEKFKQAWQGLMPLLTSGFPPVIVHRDYHVDNLMWLDAEETLAMIDFQDALIGSPAYDVVSLLKDARVEVSAEVEAKGIAYYLEKMQTSFPSSFDRKAFLAQYALWNVQRNLKILGIFARKAKRDNNPAYLVHLPRVIAHIHVGIKHPLLAPVREWLIKFAPGNFAK